MHLIKKLICDPRVLGITNRGILQASSLVTLFVFSKLLPPSKFGLYSIGVSLAMMFNFFDSIFYTATIKFCSIDDSSRGKKAKAILLILRVLFLFISLGILFFSSEWIMKIYQNQSLKPILSVFYFKLPIDMLYFYLINLSIAREEIRLTVKQNLIYTLIYFSLILLFLNIIDEPYIIFIFQSIAALIPILYILFFHREFFSFSFEFDFAYVKEIIVFSGFTSLVNINMIIYQNFDILLLGYLCGETKTGIYKIGRISSMLVFMIIRGFLVPMLPKISKCWETGDKGEIRRLYITNVRHLLTFFVPFFLISFFCAEWFFEFAYGDKYPGADIIFIFCSLMGIVSSFYNPQGIILTGSGFIKYDTYASMLCMTSNMILYFFLIPSYGPLGAVLATLISLSLGVLVKEYYIRDKILGWPFSKNSLQRIIVFLKNEKTFFVLLGGAVGIAVTGHHWEAALGIGGIWLLFRMSRKEVFGLIYAFVFFMFFAGIFDILRLPIPQLIHRIDEAVTLLFVFYIVLNLHLLKTIPKVFNVLFISGLLFLISACFSSFINHNHDNSFKFIINFMEPFIFFSGFVFLKPTEDEIRKLLGFIIKLALIQGVLGAMQFVMFVFGNDFLVDPKVRFFQDAASGTLCSYGRFGAHYLGQLMLIVSAYNFYDYIFRRTKGAGLLFVFSFMIFVITFSEISYLMVPFIFLPLILRLKFQSCLKILFGIILILSCIAFMLTKTDNYTYQRYKTYFVYEKWRETGKAKSFFALKNMWNDMMIYKFFGYGPGTFVSDATDKKRSLLYRKYFGVEKSEKSTLDLVSTSFLSLIVETGMSGLLLYLFPLFFILFLSIKNFYHSDGRVLVFSFTSFFIGIYLLFEGFIYNIFERDIFPHIFYIVSGAMIYITYHNPANSKELKKT